MERVSLNLRPEEVGPEWWKDLCGAVVVQLLVPLIETIRAWYQTTNPGVRKVRSSVGPS